MSSQKAPVPVVNNVNDSRPSPLADPLVSPVAGVTLQKFTLQNTGMTLRVATAGPPTGVPVLLMHGWPESWFSWRHQLLALAEAGYYAIAPDMRGYGHSDAPESAADYTCHHIASDMIGLMQHLGLEKAVLVGHDWGAVLTWLLGKLYPSYFPILAALSVPTNLREQGSLSPIELLNKGIGTGEDRRFFYVAYHNETSPGTLDHGPAEAEYNANIYETIFRMWSDKTVPRSTPTRHVISEKRRDGGMLARLGSVPERLPDWLSERDIDYVVEQFKHHGFRGGVNYYRNLDRNYRLTPQLVGHIVQQPCLFITGEDDPVIAMSPGGLKGQQKQLSAACADLRGFIVLKCEDEDGKRSAGHWIQQERPAEVNAHLLSFLKSTAANFKAARAATPTPSSHRQARL